MCKVLTDQALSVFVESLKKYKFCYHNGINFLLINPGPFNFNLIQAKIVDLYFSVIFRPLRVSAQLNTAQ